MRETILRVFNEALQQTDKEIQYENLNDDQILFDTELDSLGFAILVVLLEQELDYDPFQMMDVPVYPKTFGEFVSVYEKFNV